MQGECGVGFQNAFADWGAGWLWGKPCWNWRVGGFGSGGLEGDALRLAGDGLWLGRLEGGADPRRGRSRR